MTSLVLAVSAEDMGSRPSESLCSVNDLANGSARTSTNMEPAFAHAIMSPRSTRRRTVAVPEEFHQDFKANMRLAAGSPLKASVPRRQIQLAPACTKPRRSRAVHTTAQSACRASEPSRKGVGEKERWRCGALPIDWRVPIRKRVVLSGNGLLMTEVAGPQI